jgi:hypothetical protein
MLGNVISTPPSIKSDIVIDGFCNLPRKLIELIKNVFFQATNYLLRLFYDLKLYKKDLKEDVILDLNRGMKISVVINEKKEIFLNKVEEGGRDEFHLFNNFVTKINNISDELKNKMISNSHQGFMAFPCANYLNANEIFHIIPNEWKTSSINENELLVVSDKESCLEIEHNINSDGNVITCGKKQFILIDKDNHKKEIFFIDVCFNVNLNSELPVSIDRTYIKWSR